MNENKTNINWLITIQSRPSKNELNNMAILKSFDTFEYVKDLGIDLVREFEKKGKQHILIQLVKEEK